MRELKKAEIFRKLEPSRYCNVVVPLPIVQSCVHTVTALLIILVTTVRFFKHLNTKSSLWILSESIVVFIFLSKANRRISTVRKSPVLATNSNLNSPTKLILDICINIPLK